ncbi:MAG TPA: response regulator [Opitutaceae bacterium]|nr:response regulator [Opitutaceae bacterium]
MPRPTNALIVDDEPHVRTFLRLAIKEVGIATTWEAGDGAEALALFNQHRPELVLLDVNLRMMNGLQVLQQLLAIAPELPVIIVSSENAMKTVHEALRLGALDYILKHTSKDKILAALRETLAELENEEEEGDAASEDRA